LEKLCWLRRGVHWRLTCASKCLVITVKKKISPGHIWTTLYIHISFLNHFVPEIVLTVSGTATGEVSLNVNCDCWFGTAIWQFTVRYWVSDIFISLTDSWNVTLPFCHPPWLTADKLLGWTRVDSG
jgi:hypothetical protein